MKSTLFTNFNEVVENKDILKILDDIKSGLYINPITYLRKSLADNKMEAAERAKKSLPAFTPSATFKGGRKMEFLTNYTGLMVLDIDKLTTEKLKECQSKIQEDENVFASFISPSGNGLKILVKVASGKNEHKETFRKLQTYFEELLSVEIDKSGKDITRLCFVSFDPALYLNENFTVFTTIQKQSSPEDNHNAPISSIKHKPPINYDLLYTHTVSFTEKKESFVDGNRNNFVFQLANNLNRKGIPESMALGYILADYDYNSQEVATAVKSAYANTSEFSSDTFHPQKKPIKSEQSTGVKKIEGESSEPKTTDGNFSDDEDEQPSYIDKLENFLNNRYNFRYNIVLGKLEYKTLRASKWKHMTDFAENSLLREILKAKVKCSINSLRNLLHSDFCEIFDPFLNYFENNPDVSEETDWIEKLADTVTTTKQDLWRNCFKKWFVAMVACVLDEKQVNQTVIVFSGKQGLGKTTWVEKLMPQPLKEYIFSGTINPNNKDTLIHLAECMLINLDELENLNRTEIGSLKELITKTHIRMRKAYGHNNENMPRRASFAGSVNTAQFLNDTTGSRRFLCFEVEHIEYTHDIDINKVYAQASKLKKEGFRHWFNQEETKEINANNEQYQLKSPEEELLLTWFEPADRQNATYFFNTTQIAQVLASRANLNVTDTSVRKIGMALKKHGFTRISKNKIYVYPILLKEFDDVDRENKNSGTSILSPIKQEKIPYNLEN
ncbi:virulence-associated E family protein [Kaistella flava (ex Peng et al. 2021)]|uniref:Virulence-associated E family protein n=1 Tax=Kaistella flava (ex Peng et al. 2021) TaxID=2038776 RepID=A0A7M2Y7P2_9FLAO|nr:VapE domain-containing protein [Kaistella flava (ex Peng et al. 2021)]QOW10277.1 virulence-associated E family protein [Kaistella flava (ex Peng et al. 2021)]